MPEYFLVGNAGIIPTKKGLVIITLYLCKTLYLSITLQNNSTIEINPSSYCII